jgi:hypothetical protein
MSKTSSSDNAFSRLVKHLSKQEGAERRRADKLGAVKQRAIDTRSRVTHLPGRRGKKARMTSAQMAEEERKNEELSQCIQRCKSNVYPQRAAHKHRKKKSRTHSKKKKRSKKRTKKRNSKKSRRRRR